MKNYSKPLAKIYNYNSIPVMTSGYDSGSDDDYGDLPTSSSGAKQGGNYFED